MSFTRRLAFLLAVIISFSFCFTVFASAEDESADAVPDNPGITSGNALVAYCLDDEQFLYSDRLDERVAPTVAAKLVASMVVVDLLRERGLNAEDVIVTVTSSAIENSGNIADVRVPVMGFKAGDTCSAEDLLSATLVACANDAVAALACHFGEAFLDGDINDFVARMNQKVSDLGLENTNFVNPTGLDAPNQYTTPREVALIAAAFYNYNELVTLSDVEYFSFEGRTTVRSKNYLKSGYYVSGYTNKNAIGIIAGQLNKEGNYCLIAASQKEGRTYIFVVMCASGMIVEKIEEQVYYSFGEGNAYDDMNKLISWTRDSFTLITVATTDTVIGELRVNLGSDTDHVLVVPAEQVDRLIINSGNAGIVTKLVYDESLVYKKDFNGTENDTVNAPITAGQRVGTVTYSYNGIELATVDAVAKESVEHDSVKTFLSDVEDFLFGKVMKTIFMVIIGAIVIYIVVVIIMYIVKIYKKAKKKQAKKGKKVGAPKKPEPKPHSEPDPKSSTREMH